MAEAVSTYMLDNSNMFLIKEVASFNRPCHSCPLVVSGNISPTFLSTLTSEWLSGAGPRGQYRVYIMSCITHSLLRVCGHFHSTHSV